MVVVKKMVFIVLLIFKPDSNNKYLTWEPVA